MKFTAEQIEHLEKTLIMKDLRITYVGDNIFGDVDGEVYGNVRRNVYGHVEGNVKGTVFGNVEGNVRGTVFGNVEGNVWGDKA